MLSVVQHDYFQAMAENQHGFVQKLTPARGEIYVKDRVSEKPYPVATNTIKYIIYAVPREIELPDETAGKLAELLKLDRAEVLGKITDTKRGYVPLVKGVSDDLVSQVTKAKLVGIHLDEEPTRVYPAGDFLSQVVGFVGYGSEGDQRMGLYGLEKYFEKQLAGTPGVIEAEADHKGNWITGSKRTFTPAIDGVDLQLTIDRSIQFKAETVLKEAVEKHGAESGNVIIADPKTGAILAMANYPSFNPNEYNKAKNPSVYQNLATTQNFEPGSTMKTITMAAALDAGVVSPTSTFEDTGVVEIDGYKIQNSDLKAHGNVPMTYIIRESLNTGAIYVQQKTGNQRFADYLKKFGFGSATEIELPENVGNLANLKNSKADINFFTASFGQGITVTPIQMLQSYIAIANNGKIMQPYIIESITDPGKKKTEKTEPKVVREVISPRAASYTTAMLVDNVENGHGKRAGVPGYYIGGKTGTAQIAQEGKYLANTNIGSFVGFGPIEDPKFVMIVNVVKPQGVKFAESTAAPAFGEIAKFILNYMEVPPTRK
jgi:cell division protein FtsI/penicillin-binding protein 2